MRRQGPERKGGKDRVRGQVDHRYAVADWHVRARALRVDGDAIYPAIRVDKRVERHLPDDRVRRRIDDRKAVICDSINPRARGVRRDWTASAGRHGGDDFVGRRIDDGDGAGRRPTRHVSEGGGDRDGGRER